MCRKILLSICLMSLLFPCKAQSVFQQKKTARKYLAQQIIKLQVLLNYTKKGYKIVNAGLNTIGAIKNGDFKLHQLFFSDKYEVKPIVRECFPAIQSISVIRSINAEAQKLQNFLAGDTVFTSIEKRFVTRQLDNMLGVLWSDADRLREVLARDVLQMSDADRIKRLDEIYANVLVKKKWISGISSQCRLLSQQKERHITDLNTLKKLYHPHSQLQK